MQVGSLCQGGVVTVEAIATLQGAARLMRGHHVGALVVISASDVGAKVLGLLSDRDLVVEALALGAEASTTPVSAFVRGQPLAVPDTAGLSETIGAMYRAGVCRMLVTTQRQRLAGIVSLADLLAACVGDLRALAEAMRNGFAREAENGRPLHGDVATPADIHIGKPLVHWHQVMR